MSVHFEPLAPAVGAEVTGVDPCRPLDPETVAEIEAAFAEYGVLLFREAPMSPEELMAFSRHFGPLQPHVQRAYHHPDAPDVVVMTNQHADGSFDETGARRGAIENVRNGWHSDLAYDAVPAKATLLHATNVPSSGGNTCFASAAAAYEALPEETRERARGLECLFVYGTDQRNKSLAIAAQSLDKEQRATHPVINAHAVTGRAAIYANPMSTVGIVGMEQEEADRLLDEMFDMLDRPEFRWEHEWSVGDTLMWDNRGGTMHCGRLDYPRNELRRFLRTTVTGGPILPA